MSIGTQKHIFSDFAKAKPQIYGSSAEFKFENFFRGALAPTFTPLSKCSYFLNTENTNDYANDLVYQNISAIFLNGTTGQSVSLSFEERKQSQEAWMKTDAVRDGKLRVIAHVGGNSINEMINLAKHAESHQVHAISAFAPSYYKPKSAQECAELCIRIAHQTPRTPFLFYYFPGMNGIVCSVYDVQNTAKNFAPNVVGVKFTDSKYSDANLCSKNGFNVLVGAAEMASYAYAAGAHGCIGTMHNWSGNLHYNMYKSFIDGNRAKADKYAHHSGVIAKAIENSGNIFSGRAYVFEKVRGFDLGMYRYPLHNLDDAKRKDLDEFIANFNFNPQF